MGTAVATAPSVIVKDAGNNAVSGVSIVFAVATGGVPPVTPVVGVAVAVMVPTAVPVARGVPGVPGVPGTTVPVGAGTGGGGRTA